MMTTAVKDELNAVRPVTGWRWRAETTTLLRLAGTCTRPPGRT